MGVPIKSSSTVWHTYLLQCSDGSYYVGHTQDVYERLHQHNAGRAASWTAKRRPVVLKYSESYPDEQSSIRRESTQHWSRAKKEALIAGNIRVLKAMSRSRSMSKNRG
jgi:predicted GIY-YIG superfamily endonuclease